MIQEKLFATESRIMNLYKSIIDDLQKIVLSKQLLMPESSCCSVVDNSFFNL